LQYQLALQKNQQQDHGLARPLQDETYLLVVRLEQKTTSCLQKVLFAQAYLEQMPFLSPSTFRLAAWLPRSSLIAYLDSVASLNFFPIKRCLSLSFRSK
jgi:hypothetical protein